MWPNWAIYCNGQLYKACGNNYFAQIANFRQFLWRCQNPSFFQRNHFWATFIDIWWLFTGPMATIPVSETESTWSRRFDDDDAAADGVAFDVKPASLRHRGQFDDDADAGWKMGQVFTETLVQTCMRVGSRVGWFFFFFFLNYFILHFRDFQQLS